MNAATANPPRAQKYVRTSVRLRDAKAFTTVSMHAHEFRRALGYTDGDARAVRATLRHIAANLDRSEVLSGGISLVVRRRALARLRGQVRSPGARLAAENNKAWGDSLAPEPLVTGN